MPDAEHAAGLPPPTAHGALPAGRADTTPFATPGHHIDASTPEKEATRGPSGACAKSEARETTANAPPRAADSETLPGGHNREEDSFDAFMESRRSDPHADAAPAAPRVRLEPRRDHTEGTATLSRREQLERDYTARAKTEHASAMDDGPTTASGAADRALDERSAPGSVTRSKAGTNTASKPTGQPPGPILS